MPNEIDELWRISKYHTRTSRRRKAAYLLMNTDNPPFPSHILSANRQKHQRTVESCPRPCQAQAVVEAFVQMLDPDSRRRKERMIHRGLGGSDFRGKLKIHEVSRGNRSREQ